MSYQFHRPQVMDCPSCGATLAVPDAETFVCDYCGKRIVIPPALRSPQAPADKQASQGDQDAVNKKAWRQISPAEMDYRQKQQWRSRFISLVAMSIALFLIGLVLAIVMLFNPASSSRDTIESSGVELNITPLPTMVQFARLEMAFGSQGSHAGQLDDARSIAVDPRGNIFVADYSTGRVNKFDPQGNFLQLIQVLSPQEGENCYTRKIVTDDQGNLYTTCAGQIIKYNTQDGRLLLTIPDQWPEIYYESVTVAPDGNLYATNGMAGTDDVIILSPQGELLSHWKDMVENVNQDDPAIQLELAVSHSGRLYLLSPFGNQVYVYNPDGSFGFSFGQQGQRPGQFNMSTGMLAITDDDYLVISDVYRADLFDARGSYLGKTFTIDYDVAGGSIHGMAIDNSGDLYFISSGGKVLKFAVNYP